MVNIRSFLQVDETSDGPFHIETTMSRFRMGRLYACKMVLSQGLQLQFGV